MSNGFYTGTLVSIVIVLSAVYAIANERNRELIRFCLTLSGGATAIYGAYYTKLNFKRSIDNFESSTKQNQRLRSYQLIDKLSDVDYVGVRKFIRDKIKNHTYPQGKDEEHLAEIQKLINGDLAMYEKVHHVLGFFESMAVQIRVGFVDEVVLYEHCCYMVPQAFSNLENYIKEERRTGGNDAKQLYFHLEHLYNSWKDGKSLRTGEDIERVEYSTKKPS